MNRKISHENEDKIYYNIEIANPVAHNLNFVTATYVENRVQSILNVPEEYYLTISSFTIPGSSIPILICPIQPNQPNPNLSIYSIDLTYNNIDYVEDVIFITSSPFLPILPPNQPPWSNNDPYYWIFSYQWFMNLVNNALFNAFTALSAANPGLFPHAAQLIFNSTTDLFSLIVPFEYVSNGVDLYFNTNLYQLFNSFPALNFGVNLPNGKDKRILLSTDANYIYNPPFPTDIISITAGVNQIYPPVQYYLVPEEFVSLQYWNSFKSIVFTTGTIPIKNEYVPGPDPTQSGQANFLPILTSFTPTLENAGDSRSQLQYFPQGPYRLINLTGTTPLNKFDVSIYWQDIEGNLFPILILPNQFALIKFLFIKKSTYVAEF